MRTLGAGILAATASLAFGQNFAPLSTYYSNKFEDNAVVATTASANGLGPQWNYIMPDLYVLDNETAQPGSIPLNFYFNPTTNHHMTTASTQGNAYARANGFVFVRIEGYVYGTSDPSYFPLESEMLSWCLSSTRLKLFLLVCCYLRSVVFVSS
jgi:hypothetical protein